MTMRDHQGRHFCRIAGRPRGFIVFEQVRVGGLPLLGESGL